MRACLALAVAAVASTVDYVGCVVVAVATHVEDTVLLAAAFRTKISTRTILARISRQEQEEVTPRHTMQDIQGQGPAATPAAGMVRGHTR